MGQLDGQVAIVTGANRGIGKGLARMLAAEGAMVMMAARNGGLLDAAAAELRTAGAKVLSMPTDVRDEGSVAKLIDCTRDAFGRVDILVNNAGAFDDARIDQVTLDAWNNVIGACLTGAFLCTRAVFPIMAEQGGGRILNIGSISAQRPRENNAPYAAAKFGVWGLTQATAIDGRPSGILCSCLHPGNVLVERREGTAADADAEPMMSVETIARAALAMLTLPPDVNFLEAIVLPRDQLYLGRG